MGCYEQKENKPKALLRPLKHPWSICAFDCIPSKAIAPLLIQQYYLLNEEPLRVVQQGLQNNGAFRRHLKNRELIYGLLTEIWIRKNLPETPGATLLSIRCIVSLLAYRKVTNTIMRTYKFFFATLCQAESLSNVIRSHSVP